MASYLPTKPIGVRKVSPLNLAAGILAFLVYLLLWRQIATGKAEQNLLTWILWVALDLIVTITIVLQKGNFLLPLSYVIGGSITVVIIYRCRGRAKWTWFESLILLLVIACMVIWYVSGNKIATIASTIAMLIAGIPQIVEAWQKPKEMPALVYFLYTIANGLSVAGGKSWSVEERFYPVCAGILCLAIVLLAMRKKGESRA